MSECAFLVGALRQVSRSTLEMVLRDMLPLCVLILARRSAEMVEALLQGWEHQIEVPGSAGIVRPDINSLRRLLNLPVKAESPMK